MKRGEGSGPPFETPLAWRLASLGYDTAGSPVPAASFSCSKGILQQSKKSSLQHHLPSALFAIHKIHFEGKSWMSIYQDSITWPGLLSEALSGWQCSQRDLLHAIPTQHNSSRQDKAWPATTKPSRSTEQKQQIPRPPAGTDSDMQQSSDSSLKSSELGGPQTKHFTTCEQRLIG